jgi:hypothetical protein
MSISEIKGIDCEKSENNFLIFSTLQKNLGSYSKSLYQNPIAKESEQYLHAYLVNCNGIKFDEDKGEYYFKNDITKSEKLGLFSPTHASTAKRSRSAPDVEDKENYEIQRPKPQGRPRFRRNSDPYETKNAESLKRSRSTPEIDNEKIIKSQKTSRYNQAGKFASDQCHEQGTPTSSRSRSEHRPKRTVNLT